MTYVGEEKKWKVGYLRIKDLDELPNNKCAALAKLKSIEKRSLRKSKPCTKI